MLLHRASGTVGTGSPARVSHGAASCVTMTRQWNTPTRAAIHMPRPIVARPPPALAALRLRFGNRYVCVCVSVCVCIHMLDVGRWARTLVFARYILLVDVDITITELTG